MSASSSFLIRTVCILVLSLSFAACDDTDTVDERPAPPENDGIYGFVNGCYTIDAAAPGSVDAFFLEASDGGESFAFSGADEASASRFFLRASDLATYLLFDAEEHYFIADENEEGIYEFQRTAELTSDVLLNDDSYISPAEWVLEESSEEGRFLLRHYRTDDYLTLDGLSENEEEAAIITFYPASGCAEFPELTIDAEGTVEPQAWENGDVFGYAETHAHMLTNYAFGGGGIFHGSAFHRLGVEHALPSCEPFHGDEGRRDLVGFFYDGDADFDMEALLPIILAGQTSEPNHATDGYPDFTDWPNAWASSTHQTMYYRWVERAYLSGMRLLMQHATGNSVLCEFVTALGAQDTRYSCNDMVSVDRIIDETYALERYIDAQHGGPGQGWFRIVTSPSEAREVINEGKLAVLLGIEISNVFNCFLTPREGFPVCDEEHVRQQLDYYHDLGVRAVFPVHKYDNAFTAGDGHRGIIELGNFINSGYYSNLVEDCPDIPIGYDHGPITFAGLNRPRDEYQSEPPVDTSNFADDPLGTLMPIIEDLSGGGLEGEYCQNAGLTPLGEFLIRELMSRGMIIEIAHLPRRSLVRAMEIFDETDYPPASTHGNAVSGRVYRTGGISNSGFGRCADPDVPGALSAGYNDRIQLIIENGGYPAEGFSFDYNGFAHGPRPRFGEDSPCSAPQSNPVEYPFTSYAGDVTFTEPHLGNRTVDFNTEGMIHFGLLPELIEEARLDGMSEENLEALFHSAEAYIRMWELAEERSAEL